jgi:hypothetical protein
MTMTQQNTLLDLAFQLAGEGVEITYLTSGQDGKPHFTYKDAEYDLNFAGDAIRIQQSELGSLVTVTLHSIPDAWSKTVTLIIPRIWKLQNSSDAVEMVAIKCLDVMTMVPQPGALQSYEAILLKGSVQSSIPK